jgi:hypothetical protein
MPDVATVTDVVLRRTTREAVERAEQLETALRGGAAGQA